MTVQLEICRAEDETSIETIETLAKQIWAEHYYSILGKNQVEYMLEKFQSKDAIFGQIKEDYLYYLIKEYNVAIGYIAFLIKDTELFLSKFYIRSEHRGHGYGKEALKFIENKAINSKTPKITLTVNKKNVKSIKLYEEMGFNIVKPIVTDIGNGYVMDDYLMEKDLI